MGEHRDGSEPGPAAALGALVAPLRFASRDGFAALPRLVGFGETLRSAVRRAREAGAPESPALQALGAEGDGFDRLDLAGRRLALSRVAAHLAALVPVPDDLKAIARTASAGRPPASVEGRGPSAPAKPAPRPA